MLSPCRGKSRSTSLLGYFDIFSRVLFCAFFSGHFFRIFFSVLSSEPLQRQRQINKACSDTFIFFFGPLFLGIFFSAIFSVLSSEPLQWQAEADQRGLVGSFDIRRTALIMHCTSWVNCDELLSAGKYHLHIAEQI